MAELLERIPASTALDLRDRAMFELAYAAGLRAEELTLLDTRSADADGEQVRVEGKGGRTRFVPVGEHAWRALDRYLSRGRPALDSGDSEALFLSKSGRRLSTSDVRRRLRLQARQMRASRRTRCATPSPPTCSRAAPTCARSRSSSAMRPSARPKRTLG